MQTMPVRGFDHYNLRAPRAVLDELCAFYCDVVGLRQGDRPPLRHFGYWLYAGDRPALHLSQANDGELLSFDGGTTFSHAAFSCAGRRDYERRLAERGVVYRVSRVPRTGQTQLFFKDPAGNGVELCFDPGDD
jgi:catechol 2,3-dioxygenase-like lactoylglutathione lyase family enzyme